MAVLLPRGAFLTEDRPIFTQETAEPLGVSPPKAVDSFLIERPFARTWFRDSQEGRSSVETCSNNPSHESKFRQLSFMMGRQDTLACKFAAIGLIPLTGRLPAPLGPSLQSLTPGPASPGLVITRP